jgi:hypothetical protein
LSLATIGRRRETFEEGDAMDIEVDAWRYFAEQWAMPPTPRFDRGPWNGRYLPPFARRTPRVQLEPVAPRTGELDYEAYMGSIDHLVRDFWGVAGIEEPPSDEPWWFGAGAWPAPDITPDAGNLDAMSCWASFGRGEAFSFSALTLDRTRQLGCTYLWPTIDGDDPYEAANRIWVIGSELATDLDRHLLEETLAWVEEAWELNRIIHQVPRTYRRGLDVAAAVGLKEVSREARPLGARERSDDVCFLWERP